MRINIVADDLTGACDTGAAFPGAVVVLREPAPDAQVLVYSTDSRGMSPGDAAHAVRALWDRLPPADLTYKKIDSMLRGNVGAELAAVGAGPAVICPAFPEQGRTVRAGIAYPSGVDLRGFGCEVRDAESAADLRRIADEALERRPVPLLVGSAGLARAVASAIGAVGVPAPPHRPGVALLGIGSDHEATLRQIRWLARNPVGSYVHYSIDTRRPSETQLRMLRADILARDRGGLFLCGGDTARMVCDVLEVNAIRLEREILPGIPMGRLIGGPAEGLAVITKSGGFGAEDAITEVVRALG